jgi:hypothetical protein
MRNPGGAPQCGRFKARRVFFPHFIESIVTHKNRFSDKEDMHITAGRFRWRGWCSWPAGH